MKNLVSIIACLAMTISVSVNAQQLQRQYCNPLPMEIGPGGNASGDVTVLEYQDKYYMYCTGGGAWVSSDLINWKYENVEHVSRIPVAPDVAEYNGKFYMSGNDCPLYVADHPLGPYTLLGDWTNTGEISEGWNGAFDTHIYVDDDNQPYLFWPGRGISGIYGVKLNPDNLCEFVGKPVHLFGFNPMHKWERYGEMNEYPGVAWIEGPWVIKRNGIYYLEYSASGTQWKTYAEGYYTATSPLGPYVYAPNNPLLQKTEGLVTGTAHGSIVKGPDDEWWQFYTIVLSNPPGGRRIGMDKVVFDDEGFMSIDVTDTPQPAPLAVKEKDKPKSVPVTINKMRAMNALSKVSSEQFGFFGSYAVDDFSGTIWMPEEDDKEPYLMIELSPATRFDVVQLFTVDDMRIMFGGMTKQGSGRGFGRSYGDQVYKYKLEVSMDGENFTTVLDRTDNTVSRNTVFDEFEPVECRFVKLTVTSWPEGAPRGIIDFTVFGHPSTYLPAAVATPTFSDLPKDGTERR